MIWFDRVSKVYPGGAIAVDDMTLEVPEGHITVLVGPSGCGKTTSLRMVNRMVEPTSGSLFVDGEDVSRLDPAQLRRGVGYVIQHGGLFPHYTVERNVMTVPLLLGWDRAKAKTRARELLEVVGLVPELGRRYPGQLSGGQQQRVGVARALAADPPVLLMDEPFSAVDPVVREQLQDELIALQSQLHKTILFVTHDIDEAIKLGDRVAVLRVGGKLAQVDQPARLLAEPADDFVAGFVGRDRGYRSLAFQKASVDVHHEPTVRLGETAPDRGVGEDGWSLVVDNGNRPQGWVEAGTVRGPLSHDNLRLGGTLARQGGTLRAHLDAALSSPTRRGVVVDDDGVLVGIVRPREVLNAIEQAGRAEAGLAAPQEEAVQGAGPPRSQA